MRMATQGWGNLVEQHLESIDEGLTIQLEALEEATERQRDVIHYLKCTLRQIVHNNNEAAQAQKRGEEEGVRGPLSPERRLGVDSKNDAKDNSDAPKLDRSSSSLEEILARARVLRQAQTHAQPKPSSSSSSSKSKSSSKALQTKASGAAKNAFAQSRGLSNTTATRQIPTLPSAAASAKDQKSSSSAIEAAARARAAEYKSTFHDECSIHTSEIASNGHAVNNRAAKGSRNSTALQDDVMAQLAILTASSTPARSSSCSGPAISTSAGLYTAQANLLNRLRDREARVGKARGLSSGSGAGGSAELPPSLCFLMVERERERGSSGGRKDDTGANLGKYADADAPPVNLLPMLQQLKQQFDKTWRGRLERMSSSGGAVGSSLSPPERAELLTLWYRTHTCLQIYSKLLRVGSVPAGDADADADSPSASPDDAYISGLMTELLTPIMAQALVPIPRKLSTLASKEWLAGAKKSVEEHHTSLQSRLDFVLESLCGRALLKSLLRGLRVCADMQRDGLECREEWVDMLRAFQSVHCLLAKQARNYNSCLFLNGAGRGETL